MPKVRTKPLQDRPQTPPLDGSLGPPTALEPPLSTAETEELPLEEEEDQTSPHATGFASSPSPATSTPKPAVFKFHSDQPRGKRPNDFFTYWASMPPVFLNRLTAYVYRNWPVIAIMVPDRKHGGLRPSSQIAKIPGEDIIRDESDILHRFGSGDYTIRLNDCVARKSIALCIIRGLRDEDHPPCQPPDMLDVLVMDDPANQSYIAALRLKGVFQDRERQEEEDMQGQAVDRLATVIEKQMESSKKAPMEPTDTAAKTVGLVSEAVMKGIEMGRQASAGEAEAKVLAAQAASPRGEDPTQGLKMLTQVIDLVKGLQPPATAALVSPQSNPSEKALADVFMQRISDLQSQILKMNDERVAVLERELTAMRAAPPAAVASSTSTGSKDDMVSSLERLAKLKDTFPDLFGGGRTEETAEKEAPLWMRLLETAMGSLPTIATAVASAMMLSSYNNAVARTGQGAPMLPPAPPTQPTEDKVGLGFVPSQDASNPAPQGGPETRTSVYIAMLRQLERPLLNHLNDPTKTGADFAAALMDFHGRIAYDAICAMGQDALMTLLNSYPPIAAVIQQIPDQASQFISDFIHADEILAGEDNGDETTEELPAGKEALGTSEGASLPPIVRMQEPVVTSRRKGVSK